MAKMDHAKFADQILLAIGKKKPDDDKDPADDESNDEDDEGKDEPGKLGRILSGAIKHNDYEAIEEAVRKICGN